MDYWHPKTAWTCGQGNCDWCTVTSRLSSQPFKFASLLSSQKIVEKSRFIFFDIYSKTNRSGKSLRFKQVMNLQLMHIAFSLALRFQNHLTQFSSKEFKGIFQFVIINFCFMLHVGAQLLILYFKDLSVFSKH